MLIITHLLQSRRVRRRAGGCRDLSVNTKILPKKSDHMIVMTVCEDVKRIHLFGNMDFPFKSILKMKMLHIYVLKHQNSL